MTSRLFSITFVLTLAVTLGIAGWNAAPERYTFASGSRVWVEGTSSVHDWSCDAKQTSATLDATPGGGALSAIQALSVTAPVAGMDCGNGQMNGKLRDALTTAPIRFTLTNARVGSVSGGRFLVEADGQLTIKGTTRSQRVRAEGRVDGNRFRFTGEVPVTMSQFGVDPPRAMMGTLRTGDRVTVKFNVIAAR